MKDFETPETLSLELRAIGDIALTGVTIKASYAKCKSEFKCDTHAIIFGNGGGHSLIYQFDGCRIFDCRGNVFFMYWLLQSGKWFSLVWRGFMPHRERQKYAKTKS